MPRKETLTEAEKKPSEKQQLKNQNPNEQHNSKKEGLGPNTKR